MQHARGYGCMLQAEMEAEAEQLRLQQQAVQHQFQAEREAQLPPEPDGSQGQLVTTMAFRLPDGSRVTRRFTLDTAADMLFKFVDAKWGDSAGAHAGAGYQLVAQFPRRVIGPLDQRTLADLGFGQGSEVLQVDVL